MCLGRTAARKPPRTWYRLRAVLMMACCASLSGLALPAPAAETAALVSIDGAIGPATAMYVEHALDQADTSGARVVVLRLDTPGGLGLSMRDIVKRVLASPVPVIGFVAPSGARAASAGTYILYATHIAAMAPATNLGAATPVSIGGDGGPSEPAPQDKSKGDEKAPPSSAEAERRKVVNDSVAYIRSLAERRGRNADWAEKAVREGVSLTADEALSRHVVDVISANVPALLKAIDGRRVDVNGRSVTLHTASLDVVKIDPGWRVRVLSVITDPTVAYLLMLAGIFGLAIEFFSPGAIFPGVTGGICLLVALYAFQVLPVNFAGLALLAFGIALLVAEAIVPSFGVLGFGGIVAFVLGSLMLTDTDVPGYSVSIGLIAGIATAAAAALVLILSMLWRSRRRPVVTGSSGMVGELAEALEDIGEEGWVRAHGETWRARTPTPMRRGDRARVTGMDGLTLVVQPKNDSSIEANGNGEA